jgi:D-alanine-D-alanine ligase
MKKLAVLFGGVTVEHEVSVITAVQLMKHADTSKYELIPVYIDKAGTWWTGSQLQDMAFYKDLDLDNPQGLTPFSLNLNKDTNAIDAAILCFHGSYGEAGAIQGVLEVAGIPYQGPGVVGSAVCFDKIMLRHILQAADVNQAKFVWFTKHTWETDQTATLESITELGLPLFIKPANGGSTIGIEKVHSHQELAVAIANVFKYDHRVIVEAAITDCIEINVSVLGTADNCQASVPEQPIKQDEFLSYADKYQRGGGKKSGMASATRRIPAPISSQLTEKLQAHAKKVFALLDCAGVIRIDFFVNPTTEEILVIEPNTIPGSMSYYLWEASGVPYRELIDKLVEIAETRATQQSQLTTSFSTNILQKNSLTEPS